MSAEDRSTLIEWLRSELVGPVLPEQYENPHGVVRIEDGHFTALADDKAHRTFFHSLADGGPLEEVFTHPRERPRSRYVVGLLYPENSPADTLGETAVTPDGAEDRDPDGAEPDAEDEQEEDGANGKADANTADDEAGEEGRFSPENLRVGVTNRFRQSTLAISFFAEIPDNGTLVIRLPGRRRFVWQQENREFPVNGWYRKVQHGAAGAVANREAWARMPLRDDDCQIEINAGEFANNPAIPREVPVADGCPLRLRLEVFPRRHPHHGDHAGQWLVTVVLRNMTPANDNIPDMSRILFQTLFEVAVVEGRFLPYPESRVAADRQDPDERSLALLYQDFRTWAVGHGCAAAWDAGPAEVPHTIFADVMPTVETPSMTPDVWDNQGNPITFSMKELADLLPWQPGMEADPCWSRLQQLIEGYRSWIDQTAAEIPTLEPPHHQETARRHITECSDSRLRMQAGLDLLKHNDRIRRAFCLANRAMLLQQIATKVIVKRPLEYHAPSRTVRPQGRLDLPSSRLTDEDYDTNRIGSWRAFQIAFLLLSLQGCADELSTDRSAVDLIWFPTGGGKTEAYLAVAAFLMFHERLRTAMDEPGALSRDGTNVLMRYTLRLLTTQQFQRASSLVCAMECIRRDLLQSNDGSLGARPFSLGLWIGGDGSPNNNTDAGAKIACYRRDRGNGKRVGNPLILSECPWCRSEIGAYVHRPDARPDGFTETQWNGTRVRGLVEVNGEWHLRCPDPECMFGGNNTIPVHVIDETIYKHRPSIIIGTVDKFAQLAFNDKIRSIFGLTVQGAGANARVHRTGTPPALIIQDELHLISGPLGSIFGLYEGVIESHCTNELYGQHIKPKIICSTATIRGASEQVRAIFNRNAVNLFPNPGIRISDSYFGVFAKHDDGTLAQGRLYLGIHASNAGSFQTAQVRTFARTMQAVMAGIGDGMFPGTQEARRDPWWTLLLFYNSLRELGQSATLWEGDIPARLNFLQWRDGTPERRNLRHCELSGRLLQDDVVAKLDELSIAYSTPPQHPRPLDAARASNIIEVGVDIDRLSLIGVVGQPKTTAQYIQVTGRVGRRWSQRPGLVLMMYDPSKARDRSHYEQFHGYHRRLYERVEPTSATPFAAAAIERALAGAMMAHIRQHTTAGQPMFSQLHQQLFVEAAGILASRCAGVEVADQAHAQQILDEVKDVFRSRWETNVHEDWMKWALQDGDSPLMRTFEQYATAVQKRISVATPMSMRQVDSSGELAITNIDILLE